MKKDNIKVKYPIVTADGNSYMVKVYTVDHSLGTRWQADVLIKTRDKFLFVKERFEKVHEWQGWNFHNWNYKYVAIAKAAIEEYEAIQDHEQTISMKKKIEEKAWIDWNGVIK